MKPCYLFALVAGDLAHSEDTFTTCSGRKVDLRIFVQHKNISKVDFAMQSLKHAMKWDEVSAWPLLFFVSAYGFQHASHQHCKSWSEAMIKMCWQATWPLAFKNGHTSICEHKDGVHSNISA